MRLGACSFTARTEWSETFVGIVLVLAGIRRNELKNESQNYYHLGRIFWLCTLIDVNVLMTGFDGDSWLNCPSGIC
jgi:hypothetical protein